MAIIINGGRYPMKVITLQDRLKLRLLIILYHAGLLGELLSKLLDCVEEDGLFAQALSCDFDYTPKPWDIRTVLEDMIRDDLIQVSEYAHWFLILPPRFPPEEMIGCAARLALTRKGYDIIPKQQLQLVGG